MDGVVEAVGDMIPDDPAAAFLASLTGSDVRSVVQQSSLTGSDVHSVVQQSSLTCSDVHSVVQQSSLTCSDVHSVVQQSTEIPQVDSATVVIPIPNGDPITATPPNSTTPATSSATPDASGTPPVISIATPVSVTPDDTTPKRRTSARLLRSPVKKDHLSSVKQAPDHRQDQDFCTKVQVELFCCNFCQVCFETLEEIKQHLKEQPEHRAPRKPREKPFKCNQCQKGYVSSISLNRHVRKMHRKPVRRPKKPKDKEESEQKAEQEQEEVQEEEEHEEELEDSGNDEDYVEERRRGVSGRRVYKCSECGFGCSTKARLNVHMAVHSAEAEYQCETCEQMFSTKSILNQHCKRVHGVVRKSQGRGIPSLECDMCDHVAKNMQSLRDHQDVDHEGQEPTCRVCKRTADDFRRLRKHFRQQHRPGKKWRVCDICGHKSSGPSSLVLHMATHTGVRKYKCETCGMRFVRKYAMERHNEVKHLQIRRYMCGTCGQRFGTNFALQKHEEYHAAEDIKTFACQHCSEKFMRVNVLRWHIQYYHGSNPKSVAGKRLPYDRNRGPVPGLNDGSKRDLPFPCDLCRRAFSSHAVRERHIRAFHSEDTSLLCKVCGVRFGAQAKYEQHVASHNGLTSHKCRYCDKEFKRDHLRQVHESEKHTGARPWKCTCCEERFISKARMYAHRLIHYGREIKCEYCDRNFASLPLKKRHMRKHTGIKEYQCHVCNKEYKQKSNYVAHMKVHTGEKTYQCEHCADRFPDLPALRKHLEYHRALPEMQIEIHPESDLGDVQTIQIAQNLPQSVQPIQHIDILQQALQQQQHEQHQQQHQQQQHHAPQIIIHQPQQLEQQIIRGPIVHHQPQQQTQQLHQLPQTGEPIDLVAYNCDVCGQMFLSTDLLIAHCQTHVMDSHRQQQQQQQQSRSAAPGGLTLYGVVNEAGQFY